MTTPTLPVEMASKLTQTVNFENLSAWAEHRRLNVLIQLAADLTEEQTWKLRGQAEAFRFVAQLGDQAKKVLENAK